MTTKTPKQSAAKAEKGVPVTHHEAERSDEAYAPHKGQRGEEFRYARNVYFLIFGTFVALCVIAAVATMSQEASKPGFKAIKVNKPMSFFDRTYMQGEKGNPSH